MKYVQDIFFQVSKMSKKKGFESLSKIVIKREDDKYSNKAKLEVDFEKQQPMHCCIFSSTIPPPQPSNSFSLLSLTPAIWTRMVQLLIGCFYADPNPDQGMPEKNCLIAHSIGNQTTPFDLIIKHQPLSRYHRTLIPPFCLDLLWILLWSLFCTSTFSIFLT